jgi:Holliday junction resolvase
MIREALAHLGLPSHGKAIADQVMQLERGLAVEDEVSLLFCWLGRCKLIHKLDQLVAPPASSSMYQVPDLLAVFEHNGKEIPVLIEVKTCSRSSLSWRPDYITRLRRYSERIGLPLLVACKWKESPFRWTLSEIDCFQRKGATNYKLSKEEAVISNLMFVFAGNFALIFHEGITWHAKAKRLTPSKLIPNKKKSFTMTVRFEKGDYYTDAKGNRLNVPDSRLWTFFMGQPGPFSEKGDSIEIPFVNPKDTFQSADRVFERIISLYEKNLYWRELLRNYGIPDDASSLRKSAESRPDIVEKVLVTKPKRKPPFL